MNRWLLNTAVGSGLLMVALCSAVSAQAPRELATRISQVTVYPEWAFVMREAPVEVAAGPAALVIRDLPAWIDEDSIRASVAGADVTIVAATARTVFLARSSEEEVRKAEQALTDMKDQLADITEEIQVREAERDYLKNLMPWKIEKLPHEAATRPVASNELKEVNAYLAQAILDNAKRRLALVRQTRELQPELQAREKAWSLAKQRARLEKKEIVVEVDAKKAAKVTLQVGYLITGASWYPAYTARTDAEREAVLLTGEAVVQQSTGEDWSDVAFTLSTVQPYLIRSKPELVPWYVGGAAGVPTNLEQEVAQTAAPALGSLNNSSLRYLAPQSRLGAIQKKLQLYNDTNEPFQEAFRNWQGNMKQAAEVVRQAEERGTTVEFEVAGRYVVKTDGLPVKLPIGETSLRAERRYSAAPAVSRSTYVTGVMRNQATFPLLPGPVRVFLSGSFIGKSQMDFVAERERFELYLGLEERIKVTRELDAKNSATGVFSGKKRLNVAYRIQVKSFLKTPAAVEVRDQVPVSQDERVIVKLRRVSPRTDNLDKGIIVWDLPLGPGEEKELFYDYQLEYPPEVPAPAAAEALDQQINKQ